MVRIGETATRHVVDSGLAASAGNRQGTRSSAARWRRTVTHTTRIRHRRSRWHVKLVALIATPLTVLMGTAEPGLTHDAADELMGGGHGRPNDETPEGSRHEDSVLSMRLVGLHDPRSRSA